MTRLAEGDTILDIIAAIRARLPGLDVMGVEPTAAPSAVLASEIIPFKDGSAPVSVRQAFHLRVALTLLSAAPVRMSRADDGGEHKVLAYLGAVESEPFLDDPPLHCEDFPAVAAGAR
jgi:hypothetical protein